MHRAPAVSYRVVRSAPHLALIGLCWVVAVVALGCIGAAQALSVQEVLASGIVTMWCAGVAVWGWWHSPEGQLRWDGACWHWDRFAEESACNLVLRMDLQMLLMVTVTSPEGQQAWLWLDCNVDDTHWRALRRAVVA